DRVNYAVENSRLDINEKNRVITMQLTIDINICPVMEYFEIFLSRMLMCRRAANFLNCEFELIINDARLL
ncbi:MAG TPA: phosphohydrolase, partial [Syntrophomonas sp.]|nr:phosphohydrolase [Syntrophomonas sp.]